MATYYKPQGLEIILPGASEYSPISANNVVLDVPSGDDILRYVAGTVEVSGFPAGRELLAVSYLKQDIPGEGQKRVVLASGNSQPTDGVFAMDVGYFSEPVLVIALDDYGSTWTPNTTYSAGAIIHPADPAQYQGFVYECIQAGISGGDEPTWWIDDGASNTGTSGTATFRARQYFRPICHGPVQPLPKPPGT